MTDSESAENERENDGKKLGSNSYLKPNQEIKMELKYFEKINGWIGLSFGWRAIWRTKMENIVIIIN